MKAYLAKQTRGVELNSGQVLCDPRVTSECLFALNALILCTSVQRLGVGAQELSITGFFQSCVQRN